MLGFIWENCYLNMVNFQCLLILKMAVLSFKIHAGVHCYFHDESVYVSLNLNCNMGGLYVEFIYLKKMYSN